MLQLSLPIKYPMRKVLKGRSSGLIEIDPSRIRSR